MKHNFQYNRLIELQILYKDFLPFCPIDQLSLLISEIKKLDSRISKINSLTIKQAVKDVPFYFETKQSKSNFLNL